MKGLGLSRKLALRFQRKLIGKRVLPLRGEGTWQQFVKVPADLAVCIPDFIDDDTASQLYINPLTAWLICTEVLNLGVGDVLLVNACGSSIGRIFAQLSKVLGFLWWLSQGIIIIRKNYLGLGLQKLSIHQKTNCIKLL